MTRSLPLRAALVVRCPAARQAVEPDGPREARGTGASRTGGHGHGVEVAR